MERFFIVHEGTELHTDYFSWLENAKKVNKIVNKFMNEMNIETDKYHASESNFYIVPTAKDIETFGKYLTKPIEHRLRKFKSNSKINKRWLDMLEEEKIRILRKPDVRFYFNSSGRTRSRLFDIDGVLYTSIEPYTGDVPKGFTELKASEFFKVIEDYNSK
jgi:hypothetical protein